APIFAVDGRWLAVLDVSAIDPQRSERAHALTGALTVNSARAIEERFFREHFSQDWIIAIAPPGPDASGMLLAVDGDQRVVGANRVARADPSCSMIAVLKPAPACGRYSNGISSSFDARTRPILPRAWSSPAAARAALPW